MTDRLSEAPETAEEAGMRAAEEWTTTCCDSRLAGNHEEARIRAALSAALEVERRKLRAVVEALKHTNPLPQPPGTRECYVGCPRCKAERILQEG